MARASWVLDGAGSQSRLVRRLVEAERRSYAHIALPDLLVVLRIDPEAAVDTDWSTTPAVVIDATQPPERGLADIRAAIWERL